MPQNDTAGWQEYAGQEVPTLPANTDVNVKEALGETVKEADANNDPSSGANVPGVPGQQPAPASN
ncbi:hypothetical protein IJT17_09790 [bacterium]|nr:hypothetical protein [bacterium]